MARWLGPLVLLMVTNGSALELWVAPDGDDAAAGTREAPLATPAGARDAARRRRQPGEPVTIRLRAGTYRLGEPLHLTPEDSHTLWTAPDGERPVISGGRVIDGWQPIDQATWVAAVPWAEEPFYQLFVNGRRRVRARTPDAGTYLYSRRLWLDGQGFQQCVGLTAQPGDLTPELLEDETHLVLFHNWVNSYNRVATADWERQRLTFTRPAGIFFLGPQVRYYLEGARASLDAAGEWYLDSAARRVYYRPLPGEDLAAAEVVAPVLTQTLVEVRGDADAGLWVEGLVLRGLSFQHTDIDLSPDHQHSVQGAINQRGAVRLHGARQVVLERCEFAHLGEHGVSLWEACDQVAVRDCHLWDLGAGGIALSWAGGPGPADPRGIVRSVIDGNLIHDGGHLVRSGCGVFLGPAASYNQITHNEVADLSWVGIHVGWSWTGLAPTETHHNEIAYNRLHHLGNGVLNDLAGIYTLGVSPGTVLHHNLIHDVTRFERGGEGYGGWGIYLDAGSSQITVRDNVVYRTRDGGLHLHEDGQPWGDVVENNIFAYADEAQLQRNNNKEPAEGLHVRLERNVVLNTGPGMYGGGNWAAGSMFETDRNLFWSESDEPLEFFGSSLEQWRAEGRDLNSRVADPLFRDPRNGDFRLQPGSPALELGFQPIDLSTVGPSDPALRAITAGLVHRAVETAVAPVAGSLIDDFEEYEPGETPVGAIEAEGQARVVVTDEQAADGLQAMRFLDGPGVTAWKPHWYVFRQPPAGRVRWSFALRNDELRPASVAIEVRDWRKPQYSTGPYVMVAPDGGVTAGDGPDMVPVGKVANGGWVWVEIAFEHGLGASRQWSLRLAPENGPALERTGLTVRSPEFQVASWFGFSGAGTDEALFDVDVVVIE